MADVQKTIDIVFGAQNDTGGVISDISMSLNSFDASIQSLAQPFADFTKGILAVDAGLVAIGITMSGIAINEAGRFSSSIAEIGTLFNATATQSDQLSDAIIDFARSSTSSIDDINEATYIAISTGTEWADVTEALATSEALAAVSASTLAEATSVLSRTMNAYGAEADQAQEFSDALFVTVQNGDTTLSQLTASLGQVTATAAASNIDIQTLGAAIAGLTTAGIGTSEATTRLTALFRELLNPSKELATALEGMNLQSNSLQEVMGRLAVATGGEAVEMNRLFGSTEAAQAAIILANDNSRAFANTLDAMANSTGSVASNYEAMAASFERSNQNVANNLRITFIELGLPLLDEYGSAASGLSDIFKSISISFKAGVFDEVYELLEGFLGDVDRVINSVAGNLSGALEEVDFSGLAKELKLLGNELYDVFVRIFGEIDITTPEGLAEALQKAVNLLSGFVATTRGIIDFFDPIFSSLGEAANHLSQTNPAVAEAVGTFLGAMTALSSLGTVLGGLTIALQQSEANIAAVFDTLAGSGKLLWESLQIVFDGVVRGAIFMAKAVIDAIREMIPDFLEEKFAPELKAVSESFDELSRAVEESFIDNSLEARKGLDQIVTGIKNLGSESEQGKNKAKELGDGISEISSGAEKTSDELGKLKDSVSDTADALVDTQGEIDGFILSLGNIDDEATALARGLDSANQAIDANAQGFSKGNDESISYFNTIDLGNGVIELVPKNMADMSGSIDASTKSMAEATKESDKFRIAMEKIASDERIANIEANVKLNVAELEAETERVVAAFTSIDSTVQSTGDLLGDLFGSLNDASRWNQLIIEDQIEIENKRRQEALDKQNALIDEQIKHLREKTRQLARGDANILINGDGLEPQLQAFMWEIVKKVRIRANAEGQEFLLGV